jgi:hypothetical protein
MKRELIEYSYEDSGIAQLVYEDENGVEAVEYRDERIGGDVAYSSALNVERALAARPVIEMLDDRNFYQNEQRRNRT